MAKDASLSRAAAIAALILLAGASVVQASETRSRSLVVAATLPVLAELVKRIGGEYVDVYSLVPAGANPHTYEPTPKDLSVASRADLIVASGLGHARLEEVLDEYRARGLINAEIVDSTDYERYGFKPIMISGRPVPHGFWWGPKSLAALAKAIGEALASLDPAHAEYYKARASEVAEASERLSGALTGVRVALYSYAELYFAVETGADVELVLTPQPGAEPGGNVLSKLLSNPRSIDLLLVSSVDLRLSRTAYSLIRELESRGVRVALLPLGEPGWDPLSSIIASAWSVREALELERSSPVLHEAGFWAYSLLVIGVLTGLGVGVAWARRAYG